MRFVVVVVVEMPVAAARVQWLSPGAAAPCESCRSFLSDSHTLGAWEGGGGVGGGYTIFGHGLQQVLLHRASTQAAFLGGCGPGLTAPHPLC